MNASNRNLLAIALATVLFSPMASAEKGGGGRPAGQVVRDTATQTTKQAMGDVEKVTTEHKERTTTTTPQPSPPESQGAEHAAEHSSIVQRDLWTKLDANADGRISAAEGSADAGFNTDFAAMDTDNDGFVSDSEYRIAAKEVGDANTAAGGVNSASQSIAAIRGVMGRLDANADGSISLSESEADASFKTHFSAIDANSDGLVTDVEYRAWAKGQRK